LYQHHELVHSNQVLDRVSNSAIKKCFGIPYAGVGSGSDTLQQLLAEARAALEAKSSELVVLAMESATALAAAKVASDVSLAEAESRRMGEAVAAAAALAAANKVIYGVRADLVAVQLAAKLKEDNTIVQAAAGAAKAQTESEWRERLASAQASAAAAKSSLAAKEAALSMLNEVPNTLGHLTLNRPSPPLIILNRNEHLISRCL
jgi:hypothetical protein